MGLTIIPSPAEGLVNAAQQFQAGLDKFLNPNRDLQLAMQRAMASNPELIQHLADLESQAPGTAQRLGLGPLASVIQAVPASTGVLQDQATRPRAAEQAVAKQSADISNSQSTVQKNQLNSDIIQKAGKIMAADPSISFDAALKTLTGQTSAERSQEQTKADVGKAAAANTLKELQRAGNLPEDLSKVDWRDKATQFINGNLPGSEAVAYFGNGDTAKAFNEAIDAVKLDRQLAAHKAIAAMTKDRSIDNFRTQKAFQEYEKSGGVGSLQDWEKFLFDPTTQARASDLLRDPSKATEADKNLIKIAQVTKQQIDLDKIHDITLLNDKIAAQRKRLDDVRGDDDRKVMIDGLNMLLQQRSQLGGINVKAQYNDRGFFLPGRIEYVNQQGKRIDEDVVNSVIADPLATDIFQAGPQMTKAAGDAFTMIKNFGGSKEAALNKYRMQDQSANKADSKAVEAELKRQGIIK